MGQTGQTSNDSRDIKNYIQDVNLLYSRDDKFLGHFTHGGNINIQRQYLNHSPTRKIYFSKFSHKTESAIAQIVIVHGFTCSSNFVEVVESHPVVHQVGKEGVYCVYL